MPAELQSFLLPMGNVNLLDTEFAVVATCLSTPNGKRKPGQSDDLEQLLDLSTPNGKRKQVASSATSSTGRLSTPNGKRKPPSPHSQTDAQGPFYSQWET